VTGMTLLILIVVIAVTVRFGWQQSCAFSRPRVSGIAAYYIRELASGKNLLILVGVVLTITLYKGAGLSRMESAQEWVYALFAGHGTGYFRVFPFLEMLIAVGAPLYLLAVFTERTVSGQSLFITVRAKSRRGMMGGILAAGAVFLAVYGLLWLGAGLFGICLSGHGAGSAARNMLLYAVCLRFFDTMVQYLVMMCVYIFSKQITAGFLLLVAGNLLCALPGVSGLPFGISSLTRIVEWSYGAGIPAAAALGMESSLCALMVLWLLLFGCKKILD